jgi:hypothetical protein
MLIGNLLKRRKMNNKIELLWEVFYCAICWPIAIFGGILIGLLAYQLVPIISHHLNQLATFLQF